MSTSTLPSEPAAQGSPAWHAMRLGRVTASRFADVLTEPRATVAKLNGELSRTAKSYLLDLLAEAYSAIENLSGDLILAGRIAGQSEIRGSGI